MADSNSSAALEQQPAIAGSQAAQPAQQQVQIQIDGTKLAATYANFSRIIESSIG